MDLIELYSSGEWRTSWDALDGLAWRALNFSCLHPPRLDGDRPYRCIPRLRLTEGPGGNSPEYNPLSLTVYNLYPYDGQALAVRETVWRRAADADRVEEAIERTRQAVTLVPTVEVRDGSVPAEALSTLLHEASRFRLPVTWFSNTKSITSGSAGFGYEFFSEDDPPATLRLEWSWETPAEWKPVLEWIARLRKFLVGCLPDGISDPAAIREG